MAWRDIDPGELRETVGVETAPAFEDKKDGYNAIEPQWKSAGSRRAKVEQLSGREFWFATESNSGISIRVVIRYFPGLTTSKHRFIWRGMILGISSAINPDGIKIWHECMCQARAKPAEARGG